MKNFVKELSRKIRNIASGISRFLSGKGYTELRKQNPDGSITTFKKPTRNELRKQNPDGSTTPLTKSTRQELRKESRDNFVASEQKTVPDNDKPVFTVDESHWKK